MELTSIIERIGRPGLLGLAGRMKEKACAKELKTYFAEIGREILAAGLEKMSSEDVYHVQHSVRMKVGNILRRKSSMLEGILAHHLEDAYNLAAKLDYRPLTLESVMSAERYDAKQARIKKRGLKEAAKRKGPDRLGLSGKSAAEWAKEHAADLVKGVNETTINDLAAAVSAGISGQLGPDGTSKMVQDVVDGMESSRADMIATTEMNRSMSAAALDKLERLGIQYKQIILVDDACEICQSCADEDPLPVDESYNTGDDGPPFHPNCRCAVTGARPPEEE